MRIVSNTEITTHNSCELQHHYMYDLELGPRDPGMPLYRGTIGHRALEAYYKDIRDGNYDAAERSAIQVLDREISRIAVEEPWEFKKSIELGLIVDRIYAYTEVYKNDIFRPIFVEEPFKVTLYEDNELILIPDLVGEYTRGIRKGQYVLYDHKFVYNFKTLDELHLDAQLPKYMKAMRLLGYPIQHIVFNQIRTRDIKNAKPQELFRRSESMATEFSTEVIWQEQIRAVKRMNERREPVRALAPMVCKGCWYKTLCTMSMNGRPIDKTIAAEYVKRDRPMKDIWND